MEADGDPADSRGGMWNYRLPLVDVEHGGDQVECAREIAFGRGRPACGYDGVELTGPPRTAAGGCMWRDPGQRGPA